jgi:hypothetical protein
VIRYDEYRHLFLKVNSERPTAAMSDQRCESREKNPLAWRFSVNCLPFTVH